MINVFNGAGEYLELEVRQGATLGPVPHAIVLDDGQDTPFDLTGYVFRGYVKPYQSGPIVEFDFDTSRLAEGVYTFGLSDEKTATLAAGNNSFSAKSRHFWQTEMESPSGEVIPLYHGELRVQPKT